MAATRRQRGWALLLCFLICFPLTAAILPEDRFDMMYHLYQGGGVEISGPSLLFRKQVADEASMSAHYYVDSITSASIDVVSQASPEYSEKRTEYGLSGDVLNGKNILSLSYTSSNENDYQADTLNFGLSQDFFGDLTTLSMGFSRGWDTITSSERESFEEDLERRNYRLGVSQVLTKNAIIHIAYDLTADEGHLSNPYRKYRFTDSEGIEKWVNEKYPNTRTSHALGIRALYYLPYRAALGAEFRQFSDSWGIVADHWQVSYRHPLSEYLIYELRYRQYQQTKANFYEDLFDSIDQQNYMARDKELSTFTTQTLGTTVSYKVPITGQLLDSASLNLSVDHIRFNYMNFRDAGSEGFAVGEEPLYHFSANVIQLYLSVWF